MKSKRYRPLKREGNKIYWKGFAIDGDDFQGDNKLIREYNSYIRKRNRQIRKRNLKIMRTKKKFVRK